MTIFRKHLEVGNQWAQISAFVPGRTDNSIKNRFHSTMRRYHRYMEAAKQTVRRIRERGRQLGARCDDFTTTTRPR